MSKKNLVLRIAATCALLACAGTAMAQYVWLDERGVKQFSDRPPPASVPDSRILKAPKGVNSAATAASAAAESSASAAAPAASVPNELERKAAARKKEEKAAEEKKKKDTAAANCEIARQNKRTYSSQGVRVAKIGKDGEIGYMDADERAKALEETNKALVGCE
ncbi:MAG: DUF4124 domain-containing protein [Pseudomonadota bacterium]